MSEAAPLGRGSPSMSVVTPASVCPRSTAGAVRVVGHDAGGVVVEEEVVDDGRILHAVQVDPRSAAGSVVVDDVRFNERAPGEAGPALADVGVDLDAAVVVVVAVVVADDRP